MLFYSKLSHLIWWRWDKEPRWWSLNWRSSYEKWKDDREDSLGLFPLFMSLCLLPWAFDGSLGKTVYIVLVVGRWTLGADLYVSLRNPRVPTSSPARTFISLCPSRPQSGRTLVKSKTPHVSPFKPIISIEVHTNSGLIFDPVLADFWVQCHLLLSKRVLVFN